MGVEEKVRSAIRYATACARYDRDNLLCYSAALQPHFLVWVALLVLATGISEETRAICRENATEEIFGLKDEGCHFLLSREFFHQIGQIRNMHYDRVDAPVTEIYRSIKRPKVILTVLTCIEMALAEVVLPQILQAMEHLGVENFYYIEVHTDADNAESGHSAKFLESLIAENPTAEEIDLGNSLFFDLFHSILI